MTKIKPHLTPPSRPSRTRNWAYRVKHCTHTCFNPRALSRGRATPYASRCECFTQFQSSRPLTRARYVYTVVLLSRRCACFNPRALSRGRATNSCKFPQEVNRVVSILAPSHEGALPVICIIVPVAERFQSSRPLTRARYRPRMPKTGRRMSFNPRALSRGRATQCYCHSYQRTGVSILAPSHEGALLMEIV